MHPILSIAIVFLAVLAWGACILGGALASYQAEIEREDQ